MATDRVQKRVRRRADIIRHCEMTRDVAATRKPENGLRALAQRRKLRQKIERELNSY